MLGVVVMTAAGAFTATTGIGQVGRAGVAAMGAVLLAEGGRCRFCKAGDAAGVDPL